MSEKRLNELKNEVAERIKTILLEKDMYQQRLVEAIGTTKANMSNILHGKANLTLETIAKLEEALGEKLIRVTGKDDDLKRSTPRVKVAWGKK